MNKFDRIFLYFLIAFIVVLFLFLLLAVAPLFARQTQPDPKRVREIQAALISHDYPKGKNWHETQEILRSIARTYHWQTHYAPDARVLILLGLSNNDSQIIDGEHNRLDGGSDE
jgi:hypothetical protein